MPVGPVQEVGPNQATQMSSLLSSKAAEKILSPERGIHCKKGYLFPAPSLDVTNQTLAGNNLIIPGQGEFSDIAAGEGKIYHFFKVYTKGDRREAYEMSSLHL